MSVIYRRPVKKTVQLNGLKIDFESSLDPATVAPAQISLRHSQFIRFTLDNPVSVEVFLRNQEFFMRCFLTLGLQQATTVKAIKGRSPKGVDYTSDGRSVSLEIDVMFPNRDVGSLPKTVDQENMIFDLGFLGERFEQALQAWFGQSELLLPVYSLYFSVMRGSTVYPEPFFLALTRAIETYHRRRIGGEIVKKEIAEPILKTLCESLPEPTPSALRKSIINKLKYSNEYSLPKRLRHLYATHKTVVKMFLGNHSRFIYDVVNTRNYLTHFDPELREKSLSGADLYLLALKLKTFLEVCLLSELGCPEQSLIQIAKRIHRPSLLR